MVQTSQGEREKKRNKKEHFRLKITTLHVLNKLTHLK